MGMSGDTSMTCHYNVLVDSGLIGKIDSYLSFPRVPKNPEYSGELGDTRRNPVKKKLLIKVLYRPPLPPP